MAIINPSISSASYAFVSPQNIVGTNFIGAISAAFVGGLAYYPHQRSYEGNPLASVTNGIVQFRAMRPGTIKNVYLWVSDISGSGTSYYNVLKNGAGLWVGSDRLAISLGSLAPLKEALNVSVLRGDMITLDLETYAAGQAHYGPITLLVEIQ